MNLYCNKNVFVKLSFLYFRNRKLTVSCTEENFPQTQIHSIIHSHTYLEPVIYTLSLYFVSYYLNTIFISPLVFKLHLTCSSHRAVCFF